MNEYSMESFINWCDDIMIAEESLNASDADKIKREISIIQEIIDGYEGYCKTETDYVKKFGKDSYRGKKAAKLADVGKKELAIWKNGLSKIKSAKSIDEVKQLKKSLSNEIAKVSANKK